MTYLEAKMLGVLEDMLGQVENIEGILFVGPEPRAIWQYTVVRARNLVREVKRDARMDTHVAQGRKILAEITPDPPPHPDGNPF